LAEHTPRQDSLDNSTCVLVVDDDPAQRILLSETMTQTGLKVWQAENGEQAIELFGQLSPDLVLMDIKMPVMDGIEACTRMRQFKELGDIPIVLITGLEDHDSIQRAFDANATDFITKPVNWPTLSLRVRYLLKASKAFRSLRESERQLSQAQRIAVLGNWEWDIGTNSLLGSDQTFNILGLQSGRLKKANETIFKLIHPDDRNKVSELIDQSDNDSNAFSTDLRLQLADQSELSVHLEGEVIYSSDNMPLRLQGTVQDISKRKQAEEQIFNLAYYDTLTGLPNRSFFKQYARKTLIQAGRDNKKVALMFLDLDGFKRVNDTLGHDKGDELLKSISQILSKGLRATDSIAKIIPSDESSTTLSRLGGDEFTILLGDLADWKQAASVAQRVIDHLGQPVWLKDQEITITGSIGISVYPDDGEDVDTLLKNADIAMYQTKAEGKNGYKFYTEQLNVHSTERLGLETKLRRAIENDELELHYQPQVIAVSGEIIGVEALVRWNSPEKGLIPPDAFIPIAEESGLIVPLGEWVLQTACNQAVNWIDAELRGLKMSVNISSLQFRQHNFVKMVEQALEASGLAPQLLELEMTESSIMQQVEATINDLNQLKEIGLKLSIDDFGTGYSSMSFLKRFPVDTVKIDRSFIGGIGSSDEDEVIVEAILSMTRALRLNAVAEGVETAHQKQFLEERCCDEFQGYLISPAVPPAEFEAYLREGCREGSIDKEKTEQ